MDAVTQVPAPVNEPVHSYAPGSPERARLEAKLKELGGQEIQLKNINTREEYDETVKRFL